MSHMEMEWNAKWDWENYAGFGSKAIESPKKLQLADWMIVDDGEIHGGSFNLSGSGGGNSGASGSNGDHGSSAKSSISASTDSSIKDGIQTPNLRFRTIEGSYGNSSKIKEMKEKELSGTSLPPEASVGSAEALLGLKLGKRTYFENSSGVKSTSFSVMPTPPTITPKKTKLSAQNALIYCQVEGCNIDLSMAKDYHRKHRVCDTHSKCPKVTIGGAERRFCQQCSRFHGLSEFDEKKRSCRRRLADHNARRRKPQQESIQFNSAGLSTPFYGGNQQMSFVLNDSPRGNCGWDSGSSSKFTLTRAHSLKSYGNGGTHDQLHFPKTPQATIRVQNAANGLLPSKNPTSIVPNPGSKGALMSASAAPEYGRALSLLSSNSWDSCDPESIPLQHQNDSSIMQPINHAIPEGVPLSSSDFWLTGQHPHLPSTPANNSFHQNQLFKIPYDASDFYSNILN